MYYPKKKQNSSLGYLRKSASRKLIGRLAPDQAAGKTCEGSCRRRLRRSAYIDIHIPIYIYRYIWIYIYRYLSMYLSPVYIDILCMYGGMYICIIHIYIFTHIYTSIYVYIYIYCLAGRNLADSRLVNAHCVPHPSMQATDAQSSNADRSKPF